MPGALVLASASPRRRELLQRVGIRVDVRPAQIDEGSGSDEDAASYAARVAGAKAAVVASRLPGEWVLGADTVVEIDGAILGKPRDWADAERMLGQLLGREHRVTTAFALLGPDGTRWERQVTTTVFMRAAWAGELAGYLQTEEWRDRAGGYAVQGMAAGFVAAVHGSITNVIGLPLAEVLEVLRTAGAAEPDYASGVCGA